MDPRDERVERQMKMPLEPRAIWREQIVRIRESFPYHIRQAGRSVERIKYELLKAMQIEKILRWAFRMDQKAKEKSK